MNNRSKMREHLKKAEELLAEEEVEDTDPEMHVVLAMAHALVALASTMDEIAQAYKYRPS